MSIINLTPTQLRQAADLKEEIEKLQHKLNQLQGAKAAPASAPVSAPAPKPATKKFKFSAAGIARIRAAQKARWAKIKAAAKPVAKPAAAPAKRGPKTMSAEARAKIAAAARARWAKVRAAKAAKK